MTVKTENIEAEPIKIIDDLDDVSQDKLQALKAKLAAKQEESKMPIKIVEEKTRSFKLGFVGSGQGGSRLAATFHQLGYSAVCFNTAAQDLKPIKLPEDHKLLLDQGLHGAAKDLSLGQQAAEMHKEAIYELVSDKLASAEILVFCLSLGGGSGAGSCSPVIDILNSIGKPIVVITILPMNSDDAQLKKNSLETLSKIAKEVQNKRVHNCIVVDNAKIESIYSNISQMDFFDVSNKAIAEPLDIFNTLSSMDSPVKPLDGAEFLKLLVDGSGLSVYGESIVHDYQEETSLAEAVLNNLSSGLLASGFNVKESKYVGVMMAAPKRVWDKIPSGHLSYAKLMIQDSCATPAFWGLYVVDSPDDSIKVYSMFSGLSLPTARVEQLKKEAAEFVAKLKNKDEERNLNLRLETGDEVLSAADKIKQQISAKKSAFGSFVSSVQDRRK